MKGNTSPYTAVGFAVYKGRVHSQCYRVLTVAQQRQSDRGYVPSLGSCDKEAGAPGGCRSGQPKSLANGLGPGHGGPRASPSSVPVSQPPISPNLYFYICKMG